MNWRTMVEPASSGGPVSIPVVGNSEAAKQKVAALVSVMGLEPIDLGGLENARWVEGMLILWINNRINSRQSFDFYLRPNRCSRSSHSGHHFDSGSIEPLQAEQQHTCIAADVVAVEVGVAIGHADFPLARCPPVHAKMQLVEYAATSPQESIEKLNLTPFSF